MRAARTIQPLLVLAVAGLLAWAALAQPAAAPLGREATVRAAADGALSVTGRADGAPVFTLEGAGPGSRGEGRMEVTNPLGTASTLQLRGTGVTDAPGPLGGTLREVLLLRVFEGAAGDEVLRFAGRPSELTPIDLGGIGPGATRSFRFAVEWVDGGAPAGPGLGDNALQGARTSMGWAFAVDVPEGGVAAATAQSPEVALTAYNPVRRCLSRRAFGLTVQAKGVRDARIWVAGERIGVRIRRGRARAAIDLRGWDRGTVRVDIAVTLRSGRRLAGTRRYRLCATRGARRTVPKL